MTQSKFLVQSESTEAQYYEVTWVGKKWSCNCPDFVSKEKTCKHIHAVNYYLTVKAFSPLKSDAENKSVCRKCGSSENKPHASRFNKSGPVLRLRCQKCGATFTDRSGFENMKNSSKIIVAALDLYYKGLSLRKISEHFQTLYRVEISYTTIYYWLAKYVELVEKYAPNTPVTTGERQGADETMLRIRGRHIMLWGLLNRQTKVLVAEHISQRRSTEDAKALLEKGQSKTKPMEGQISELTTDGLGSYSEALKLLRDERSVPLIHVQGPGLTGSGGANNNETERLMGTVKERTKLAKHFYSEESAKIFSKGFGRYYNDCRGHMALNGKTPAQAAGLEQKKLTWMDLISRAKRKEKQKEADSPRPRDKLDEFV